MPAETRGSVRQRKAAAVRAEQDPNPRVVELNTDDDEEEFIKNGSTGPLQQEPRPKPTPKARVKNDDEEYSPWVDVLRVLTFLVLAGVGLSYLISSGTTFGLDKLAKHPPKYFQKAWWEEQFKTPLQLTLSELSAYDGSDPEKPIYLAINGTIYDVSANRRTYGPGGSYHVFAGVDAARGFVTGCFADDRTADLGGGLGRALVAGEWNSAIYPPLAAAVGSADKHLPKDRTRGISRIEAPELRQP
ncbi:hypothetical protein G7054_g767 [Neopestalotiopsis clavispora]|nr:hypothetical protein G7054_g767 [Neopestalotiopsis clavispora]